MYKKKEIVSLSPISGPKKTNDVSVSTLEVKDQVKNLKNSPQKKCTGKQFLTGSLLKRLLIVFLFMGGMGGFFIIVTKSKCYCNEIKVYCNGIKVYCNGIKVPISRPVVTETVK